MTIDPRQFHQTFFEESLENLDAMERNLLELQPGDEDAELVNSIFRAAHSIKGGSATFGFDPVTEMTHVLETALDEVRGGTRVTTTGFIDLCLRCVDCLRHMLEALRSESAMDQDRIDALQKELNDTLGRGAAKRDRAPAGAASGWFVTFRPQPGLLLTGNEPIWIFRDLASLGDLELTADVSRIPPLRSLDPDELHIEWGIEVSATVPESDVREPFAWVDDLCELDITPLGEAAPAASAAPKAAPPRKTAAPAKPAAAAREADAIRADAAQTPDKDADKPAAARKRASGDASSIRVSTEKVDELINMVGELVITQSMLGEMSEDFDVRDIDRLREGLVELERNTRELQESAMRIRMLPISFAFQRFPRLVHDMSARMGKRIELVLTGEQTELDKTVLEKIGDPLVHLVRNSLDHGIEKPEVRAAAGKPETGTVELAAYHQGGAIVIEIRDDGAGLDTDRILQIARERGVVGPDETLDEERIHDLIFAPGFSTAAEVSDVSGRGVGMDVVRRNIKALGGKVEVASVRGKGSTITIRLPLTLAILDGQLLRVADQTYILPLVSIVESVQILKGNLNAIAGRARMYNIRNEFIPIIELRQEFGLGEPAAELAGGLLVIVEAEGQKVGLVVDELLGQQQVVIKSLEANYGKVEGMSGATILGDGTVSLILDVSGLVAHHRSSFRHRAPRAGAGPAAEAPAMAAAGAEGDPS